MIYNVAEYVVGWLFCGLQHSEKVDLSQTVFLWYINVTYTHLHTHTDKSTIAVDETATRCFSPKNK